MNKINSAVKNSIISLILGDMMGLPIQFTQRENFKESLKGHNIREFIERDTSKDIPFGSWSDDSSMTLCTMASIIKSQNIDIEDIYEQFSKWLLSGYLTPTGMTFDVGNITSSAIKKYICWKELENCSTPLEPMGLSNTFSNGNGSLMRILPVSLYCYFKKLNAQETFETIKNVSALTHAHPISVLGCYIYTHIVFDILNGKTKDEIIENLKTITDDKVIPNDYKEYLDEYERVISGSIIHETEENINSEGYVRYTLEVALWGFYNTDSVENCIFKIVELCHDTDTNAAVGGSLSGLYYALNNEFAQDYWVNKIIKKEMIFELIEQYINFLNI